MEKFQNKIALITGGASGIGKLMGSILLQKGLQTLVVWDLDEKALKAVSDEWTNQGFHVIPYVVNVMDTRAVIETARLMSRDLTGIDILINNAGIIIGKTFEEHDHQEIDRTMQINSSALMHIALEFLPSMISRKSGHIVNIASAAGMLGNPTMSVYAASKSAVIGWSDSLWLEFKKKHPQLRVTTVTPFYINTGMFEGVKSRLIPIVNSEFAAFKIIQGIEKDKRFVRMPGIIYLLPLVKGLLPASWFDRVVGTWLGIYKTMDTFRGRKPS